MAALGGRASCLGLCAARPAAVPPRARLVVEAGRSQKRERQRQRKSADQGKVGGCGRRPSAAAAAERQRLTSQARMRMFCIG